MTRATSDAGVTEIIGFVLILALVVVVLSLVAVVVPPIHGASLENEMTGTAIWSISDMKYDMDLMWEGGFVLPNATRSVLIQLANPRKGVIATLPVFEPQIGSATLSTGISDTKLTFDNVTYANLLSVTYSTANRYAPDAVVMYDCGAVFGGTDGHKTLLLSPSVGKIEDGNDLLIVLPVFSGPGSGSSVSGNRFGVLEYCAVEGNTSQPQKNPKITISGNPEVTKVWAKFFPGISETPEGSGTYVLETYPGSVTVMTVPYQATARGAVYDAAQF